MNGCKVAMATKNTTRRLSFPIGANSATLVIADELCKLRRVASHVNLRMRGRTRVIVFVVLRLVSFQCAIEVPPFTGGGVGSVAPLDVPP